MGARKFLKNWNNPEKRKSFIDRLGISSQQAVRNADILIREIKRQNMFITKEFVKEKKKEMGKF